MRGWLIAAAGVGLAIGVILTPGPQLILGVLAGVLIGLGVAQAAVDARDGA